MDWFSDHIEGVNYIAVKKVHPTIVPQPPEPIGLAEIQSEYLG